MDHFDGVTPEQRWKNELLREIKNLNNNIRQGVNIFGMKPMEATRTTGVDP